LPIVLQHNIKFMKNYILLVFALAIVSGLHAQTLTILDANTKEPVPFATLYSSNPEAQAITGVSGQTDIQAFKGSTGIEVRSLGYKTQTLSYEAIASASFTLYLEAVNFSLDEVVVSATGWRQLASKVPAKIIRISTEEIGLQNPQTAADLLGISGKVFIQKSQQGGGSPMIRGFATNRLLYAVDGVRMNTAIFRGGNIQNVINLDPFTISATEVLFGPGSVIYGSDAIGGVMSFQTLQPKLSNSGKTLFAGKAITRYSSANNEKTGHLDFTIGGKKWSAVTSVSRWDYDNLRQGSMGPEDYIKSFYVERQGEADVVVTQDDPLLQIPSAYTQTNAMQKIRFKPNQNWDLQYSFHYSETSDYGRYDRHNRLKNGTARYAEWNYGPQLWMMNHLQVNHNDSNKLYDQMTLRLAQQTFEESRIDRTLNKNDRTTQVEKVLAYSANLDFTKMLNEKHHWYYGLEFVTNDVSSDGTVTDISTAAVTEGSSRYPQSTWTSLAAYLTDAYEVNSKLTLQSGLRYTGYRLRADFSNNLPYYPLPFSKAELNNAALTGSVGLVYRPAETWVLSSNLGTAFRSPNVDDIGKIFDSEPGAVTVPNPDLKAEYAWNIDFGIAKVFSDKFKIDLTAFYTHLDNALVRRDFTLNGESTILYDGVQSQVQAIQNAAVAKIYGLQAGVEWMIANGLRFSSDLNIQVGEEELDDGSTSTSRHAAPTYGISRISWIKHKLNLQIYAMYQAERSHDKLPQEEQGKTEIYAKDAGGNTYSPAWYTLNIKAMYPISKSITLNAGIENLTDQRYRPYSSGISGAGRNFVLSLAAQL
jgi:hemoglobin/transferrin/lactoferrin receptor protein